MRIIAFIQEDEPIRAILKHLNLWEHPRRALPRKVPVPVQKLLFPRKDKAFRYPPQDEYETQISPVLMAAESWEEYHDKPVPIEYHAIDPPFYED